MPSTLRNATLTLHPWLLPSPTSSAPEGASNHEVAPFHPGLREKKSLELGGYISTPGQGVVATIGFFNENLPENDLACGVDASNNDLASHFMNVSQRQMQLAQQLIDVLGEAVRLRVKHQAGLCSNCLQAKLLSRKCNNSSQEISQTMANEISHSSNQVSKPQCNSVTSQKNVSSHLSQASGRDISNFSHEEPPAELSSVTDIGDGSSQNQEGGCTHATVAVLFSGGIDCLVIAALADR